MSIPTCLPLNRHAFIEQKHALVRRFNEDVSLPVFTIEPDEDLIVASPGFMVAD
jgi:hypothetical protein